MPNSVHKVNATVPRPKSKQFRDGARRKRIRETLESFWIFPSRSVDRERDVLESPTVERAGEFLGRVAQRLGKPEAAIAWLGAAWPSIVGSALAAHTRPVRCESGC